MASSKPLSLTVCGVAQFVGVKVRGPVRTEASAGLSTDMEKLTFAVGCEVSAMVAVAWAPASLSAPLGLVRR